MGAIDQSSLSFPVSSSHPQCMVNVPINRLARESRWSRNFETKFFPGEEFKI